MEMTDAIVSVSPASFVQRSMWASAQRYRHAPLNVMNLAWRVRGVLRVAVLERALADLVERHPTLRSRLTLQGGQLLQEVLEPTPVTVIESAVQGDGEEARLACAVAMLRDLGRQAIDVVTGPPMRVHLLSMASDDQLLGLCVHHAMCDGWSSQIIVQDLLRFYEARAYGQKAELPALAVQYADVAAAQIRDSETGGYDDAIKYWRAELSGLAPQTALPSSGTRKGNRDFFASSPLQAEPTQVLAAVREAARKSKVSTFSFLLAAVAVLVRGRTGSQDLIVGVPTLNRWSRDEMQFVGCATSLLPARIRPEPGMSFAELSQQVHATVRRLLAYGRIPLELILRETQSSPMGGPVFPVWCQTRQEAPIARIESLQLSFAPELIERGTLLADLDVDMIESPSGLLCEFAHRPSLFSSDFIAALMTHYGQILRAAALEPAVGIDSLCPN